MPNPTSTLEAISMIETALRGEKVNDAELLPFGTCAYTHKHGNTCGTCIVGVLLTPEQRKVIFDGKQNAQAILYVMNVLPEIKQALRKVDSEFLDELQSAFDAAVIDPNQTRAKIEGVLARYKEN